MTDLRTTYLGLDLRSPLVASAGPHNDRPDRARALEDAGAAAIVLPSLFEEEILHDELQLAAALEQGAGQHPEAHDYFPTLDEVPHAGDRYLAAVEAVKAAVAVPVIASLNATHPGAWVRWAGLVADAGADAVELNLYHVAADPSRSSADVEAADLELIAAVRDSVDVPVAVKLSPFYSATANFALAAVAAGAHGLVLFNRFYQPDLDLDSFDVVARVDLSHPADLRLPMRWIAILRPQLGPGVSLAASSGVHSGTDAVKALMVGADVAMMTSAVLHHGPGHFATVEAELVAWLAQHEYGSVDQLRGSASYASVADPSAYERANYLRTLHSWPAP